MKLVIFYISDHGFGHAARNIPIIHQLLNLNQQLKVIVKTGVLQGEFIEFNFINQERLTVMKQPMDIGLILKPMSFEIDVPVLEEKLDEYLQSWDTRIEEEVQFLKEYQPDLIVSDIVLWEFRAVTQANVMSVLISNFTWVDIYEEYLSSKVIEAYQDCYDLANHVFIYDLAGSAMKQRFAKYEPMSLCARPFNVEAVADIQSRYDQPLVFVSVGRSVDLAEVIDVSNEPYQFIVTEGIQLEGPNVTYLPKEVENTQDYVCASEFVITKAGFGTISEALLAQKKIAVIERHQIAEDRATVQSLIERGLAISVKYERGLAIHQILKQLEQFTPKYDEVSLSNDNQKIAQRLLALREKEDDHHLLNLKSYGKEDLGYLVPLDETLPFKAERVFYLTDVPTGGSRGRHAYHQTKQVLICLSGEVKVKCTVGETKVIYQLQTNKQGLYLEPHVWREVYDFSDGAVLLAISSQPYNEEDYRR